MAEKMVEGRVAFYKEEEVDELIREWRRKKKDAHDAHRKDDVMIASIYVDALQSVRRVHGFKPLKVDE